jgi:hypothetical protein
MKEKRFGKISLGVVVGVGMAYQQQRRHREQFKLLKRPGTISCACRNMYFLP